ncbi:hypothetical protein KM043_012557 [Ampulex compressa]|nr:hypothetical protein KM043_012557 [Ampulex compressa]
MNELAEKPSGGHGFPPFDAPTKRKARNAPPTGVRRSRNNSYARLTSSTAMEPPSFDKKKKIARHERRLLARNRVLLGESGLERVETPKSEETEQERGLREVTFNGIVTGWDDYLPNTGAHDVARKTR